MTTPAPSAAGPGAGYAIRRVSTDVPDVVLQACQVVRASITYCCVADHCGDAQVLRGWLANKTPDNLAAWMSAPGAMAWGAYCTEGADESMVGFALVARPATLALCYLLPEALHRGIGRALLHAAEAGARDAGADALVLDSTRTGLSFYLRNGYASAGDALTWAGLWAQPLRKPL